MAERSLQVVTLVLACALTGCTQWRHYELGLPIAAGEVPQPEQGLTVTQVMAKFGPPLLRSSESSGYTMAREFWEIGTHPLNLYPRGSSPKP